MTLGLNPNLPKRHHCLLMDRQGPRCREDHHPHQFEISVIIQDPCHHQQHEAPPVHQLQHPFPNIDRVQGLLLRCQAEVLRQSVDLVFGGGGLLNILEDNIF